MNQLDNCYLGLQNTENPDVAFQRVGSEDHIDLFFAKPNKHGLCEKSPVLSDFKNRPNNNDLTISQSGTKAARALHLLVFDHK